MQFSTLAKITKPDLILSKRYEDWVAKNSNPKYSQAALGFAAEQLEAQAHPRKRGGTVSASSLGKCPRRQQFVFLGLPEVGPTPKLGAIFQNGTFMHIRWQMAGLSEGFLKAAEVAVPPNEYRLMGTMDGIAYEDSVVEFKSCNTNSFTKAVSFGPLWGHEEQLGTYLLATGREKGIFIYEDKNNQSYVEIVKTRAELPLKQIAERVKRLWDSIDSEKLAEPLDAIYEMKQPCSSCPFSELCYDVKSWAQAKEIADVHA